MRDNGTVSGREIELRDDQLIISHTDTRGLIVYVNPDFVEIIGYSEAELIGQPHNIVRHPNMPREIFADLWATLKAGRPWVGMLRNRCKNGDEYWVEAHVSPILDKGVVSGFMSMRRKATPDQIAEAKQAYATLQQRKDGENLIFRNGRLAKGSLRNTLRMRLNKMPLAIKFVSSALLAAIVLLGATTHFLASHVSQALNDNARHQLRHDVGLLRAAVAAHVERANIGAVENSKTLAERVYEALGGQSKASTRALLSLTEPGAVSRNNPIDAFMHDLDGAATIFVLTHEGLQRRMTTAVNEYGDSAVGSFLDIEHPALKLLLEGKPYVGPARVFGVNYITSYTPILDGSGAIIGASVIGIDLAKQLATLKEQIRSMKVGATGYYYITDASPGPYFGTMILHPYQEGKILSDVRESGGRGLITEMARLRRGEIKYPWKNVEAGETEEREKLVIFDSLESPNWVIAGGSSIDEFTALARSMGWLVVIGGLAIASVIFVIVLVLLRNLILRPLNTQVLPTFQAMSAGRFDTPLDVSNEDEIGQVIQGLESLRNRLAFESERERTLSRLHDKARLEAENLSRARAEFLANMSHEIRTPLNAVIGLTYLLTQSSLKERDFEYVKRIEGAGKLLLAIVNDILDFSKIDAGELHLEEVPFRLDDILDNLSNLLRMRIHEKGLVLEYVVAPGVPQSFRGDALRLSQILINLVGNAIKFTATGSITVFVYAASVNDDRAEIEFRIQDTGIGMSEEQISNLFRAFCQADGSVTRKFGGTGLGLVISKRLIEMMGGSIWVDSKPAIGSTFAFKIFLDIEDAEVMPLSKPGYRVLLVDDNDLARLVLERILIKNGCLVRAVDSGEAALAEIRNAESAPFDCIMVDLNMPDMDGLALGHHIRVERGQATKLVMVTGENVHASQYCNALGDFDDVVEKPVTASRISEVLGQQLDRRVPSPPTPNRPSAPLAGLRILVAEDVPTNQLIMRDLLESLGATVHMAGNGKLALEQLGVSGDSIDLILMDIQMPEMDGLEATRRIRSGTIRADIPIVALTAHALEEERQRAIAAGMNEFLTKPIDPERLIELIQRWRPANAAQTAAHAVAAEPAPEASMPALPGIDVENGLHRMLNKQALYAKVLRDFNTRFTGESKRIGDALAAGDNEAAARYAHSLKGTGGMIGAKPLAALAAELEQAIRNGSTEEVSGGLDRFARELSVVLDGIASAYPPAPPP